MSAAGKSIFGAGAVGATQTTNATGSTTLDFDTYQNFVLTATGNVTLAIFLWEANFDWKALE